MKRRKFIAATATATTALLFSPVDMSANLQTVKNMDTNFQLKILATNWGFTGTMDEYCAKVKQEGYDGIEIWWPPEKKQQDELFDALKKYGLEVGFLTAGHESVFSDHFDTFKKMIEPAVSNKIQTPLYINCHSGRDYFSFEDNKKMVDYTTQLSKHSGIKIYHETHRSRMLFAAPVARKFMESIPDIRITLDVSHWCNVSETLLDDQPETLALAIQHADHIHARIGHPEGPQVNDPRAPEWQAAVDAHFNWWDKIVALKKQKGEVLTILTEFGPADYMPTLPYTRQPLADQWAINVYMMHLLKKRYLNADRKNKYLRAHFKMSMIIQCFAAAGFKILSIPEFIGHFHPVLVHLPIGVLLTGLLLQWLATKKRYSHLKVAVPVILLCGVITSGISCITGYLLSISDDYDKSLVSWHMWMAIAVLFVSFLLYLKELNPQFGINKQLTSIGLFLLISFTGHLGGSLTHGSDYLTRPLKDIFSKDSTESTAIKPLANVQEAVAYNDVVRPVLQTKCYSCHNAGKQKGGLRMDEINALMQGGKDGKVLVPGNAAASEMIKRLLLPTDNDKHMPPKEKPQPSENQVALLQWWIGSGADFTKKVKESEQPAKIKPMLAALQQPTIIIKKEPDDLPTVVVEKADEKILAQLKDHGIMVLPVAQNSNYLTADFVTDSTVAESDLKLLEQLKKQLVWLKLNNTNTGDNNAAAISRLTALTRLNVANTLLSDKGLQQLSTLKNLQYLNLTGTKITATGLLQLKQSVKLKNIYLYRTNLKTTEYANLKKTFTEAIIDTGGYQVGLLVSDTTRVKAEKLQ